MLMLRVPVGEAKRERKKKKRRKKRKDNINNPVKGGEKRGVIMERAHGARRGFAEILLQSRYLTSCAPCDRPGLTLTHLTERWRDLQTTKCPDSGQSCPSTRDFKDLRGPSIFDSVNIQHMV